MFGFGKSSSPSEWVIKNIENGLYVTVGTFGTSEWGVEGATRFQRSGDAYDAISGLPGDLSKYVVEKF
ncbi:hypothetical protein C1Y38_10615 [Limosilactobacillus fermentum]|uniref:Uncharacterized protein n=1 Tax=Limosilactobacillus fermentum TaxID=1613 RepID=A0A2K2TG94_LIMFE|nr:hypothetical protein C1Y38_10615 [Limosilactobacillus fermentum]SPE16709.1 hypothetical protein LAF9269_01751 [Limosilactobacillus fermentum]